MTDDTLNFVHTTFQVCGRIPVDVVLFNVRQRRAATVPGP